MVSLPDGRGCWWYAAGFIVRAQWNCCGIKRWGLAFARTVDAGAQLLHCFRFRRGRPHQETAPVCNTTFVTSFCMVLKIL